jgi:hypothetical protein
VSVTKKISRAFEGRINFGFGALPGTLTCGLGAVAATPVRHQGGQGGCGKNENCAIFQNDFLVFFIFFRSKFTTDHGHDINQSRPKTVLENGRCQGKSIGVFRSTLEWDPIETLVCPNREFTDRVS